ncbi:DUF2270 domain-containing protein [Halorussus limi]|uniref:DUF2270 domain-containing protein n=1 Tax=Halorussus limi TaxID=2938695 RepID=A0A8U0HX12_9EURY|nr:DUF2270 domain-containing protein [Halorussus limi]UPV75261.1 DUF2270 domain-containing protein [Halorussus limi]
MGGSGDAAADGRDEATVSDPSDDSEGPDESIGEAFAEDPSDAISLLGHFYRGQMDRVTAWRGRLDQTSYWAVTIIAALLTWVFSSANNPHYLLLIGMGALVVFLAVETRRYRAYDVWRERVRLLEQDLFAELFDPDRDISHPDWRRRISEDLRNPAVKTPLFTAFSRRLRRIYYPLSLVLLAAWVARVTVFQPKQSWRATASVLSVPGTAVVAGVAVFYLAATAAVVYGLVRRSGGEFHERESTDPWRE